MRKANYSEPSIKLEDLPDLLNVEQACLVLDLSRPTVSKMLNNGKIKAEKYGREWRIYKSQFEN